MDYKTFKDTINNAGAVEKAIGLLIIERCTNPDDPNSALIQRFLVMGAMARKYKDMCKLSPKDAMFCEMMLDTMEQATNTVDS